MSSRFREKSYKTETKKEFIIRVAKNDPFLKIEEIADQAKTTQRYVRTILSEANLSLMNLREEYARKMEKQSEAKILFSVKDSVGILDFSLDQSKVSFTYGKPRFISFKNIENCNWNCEDQPLYQYMQSVNCNDQTIGLIIYITSIKLANEQLANGTEVYQCLGLDQPDARLINPEIEFGRLSELIHNNQIQSMFGADRAIIKIKTFVNQQNKVLGEETFIFPSDVIKVTIPGVFSPVLQLAK